LRGRDIAGFPDLLVFGTRGLIPNTKAPVWGNSGCSMGGGSKGMYLARELGESTLVTIGIGHLRQTSTLHKSRLIQWDANRLRHDPEHRYDHYTITSTQINTE
jgi:hypothetical protein